MNIETRIASIIMIVLALGCGGQKDGNTPAATASRYFDAVRAAEWTIAWGMVSADDRSALPLDVFVAEHVEQEELHQALQKGLTYRIVSTSIDGDKAAVSIEFTSPAVGDVPTKRKLRLVREENQWHIDTDWAEEKTREEREVMATTLKEEVNRAMQRNELEVAKSLLERALALTPDDPELQRAQAAVEELRKAIIAGRWRLIEEKDAMTDDRNVTLALTATTGIEHFGTQKYAFLVARCSRRSFDLFIVAQVMVEGGDSYYNMHTVSGQYRFDDQPAKPIRFSMSDSRDAVFFSKPREWAKMLGERANSKLAVELPIFMHGRQVIMFDLEGADVAMAKALESCR